jgi:predicted esterase
MMMENSGASAQPADQPGRFKRQAVVLCHGIGEQKPMDTLTNFVWAIHPEDVKKLSPGRGMVRSYPQDVTDNLERRSFSEFERGPGRWITDFYELYWSHLKARTNVNFVFLKWLSRMLKLEKESIPPNLAKAFKVVRCIRGSLFFVGIVLAMMLAFVAGMPAGPCRGLWSFFMILLVTFLIAVYLFYLPNVTNVLVEIARYLDAEPENIKSRQSIRQAGIDLLNKLHESRELDGELRYERIIVVGHSLGSIIALTSS